MDNFKDELFSKYFSTHILHLEGKPTILSFKSKSISWQKHFSKFIPNHKDARIIDAGCGDGSFIWWLQKNGYINAEGVEFDSEQVNIANSLGVKKIYQGDFKKYLETKVSTYDLIILRDVIEHFSKQDIIEILKTCYNALMENGSLIVQVPNAESPFFGRIRYGDFTHEVAFSTRSLAQVFNLIGFQRYSFYPTGLIIRGIKSFIRFILWKIIEGFYQLALFAELGSGKRIVTQNIIAVAMKKK